MNYNFGKILKETREAKGNTLEDMHKLSRIKTEYIKALESEDIDELPDISYARSFLFTYCKILEVENPSYIMKCFDLKASGQKTFVEPEEDDDDSGYHVKAEPEKPKFQKPPTKSSAPIRKEKNVIGRLLVAILVVVILGAIYFYQQDLINSSLKEANKLIFDNRVKYRERIAVENFKLEDANYHIFRNYCLDTKALEHLSKPYKLMFDNWEYGIGFEYNPVRTGSMKQYMHLFEQGNFFRKEKESPIYSLGVFSATYKWKYNTSN